MVSDYSSNKWAFLLQLNFGDLAMLIDLFSQNICLCILRIKISLWCAFFAGSWLHIYKMNLNFKKPRWKQQLRGNYSTVRGAFNKFPDIFVEAFKVVVDSWKTLMRWLTNFLWFQFQMNSYCSNWNTPY